MSISVERERDETIARIKYELDTSGLIPVDLVLEAHALGIIVTDVEEDNNG